MSEGGRESHRRGACYQNGKPRQLSTNSNRPAEAKNIDTVLFPNVQDMDIDGID